jgi:hypothetical protein
VALLHNRTSDHEDIENEANLSVIGVALVVLELVGAALEREKVAGDHLQERLVELLLSAVGVDLH